MLRIENPCRLFQLDADERNRVRDQHAVGGGQRVARADGQVTPDGLGGPQGLQGAITIAVGHDPAGLFPAAWSRPAHQARPQPRYPVLIRTARGQHPAVGAQHHRGRRQRLAERRHQARNSAAQGLAGHRLLLLDDALHGAHLVGVDLVDHRPGDRDEGGGTPGP